MARWHGKIGYRSTIETLPGIWEEVIRERDYRGDVTRVSRRLESPSKINADVSLNAQISAVADAYARDNFADIVYVEWAGRKWRVSSVEPLRPRLILSLGGIYDTSQQ